VTLVLGEPFTFAANVCVWPVVIPALIGLIVTDVDPSVIAKGIPLLVVPLTVTTMLPVVAPEGTGVVMLVAPHSDGVAGIALNVTVLVLCVAPKFVPVITTCVPATPDVGFKLVIVGTVETLKVTVLSVLVETVFCNPLAVAAPAGMETITVPD
jgi:hypothetical protein